MLPHNDAFNGSWDVKWRVERVKFTKRFLKEKNLSEFKLLFPLVLVSISSSLVLNNESAVIFVIQIGVFTILLQTYWKMSH